MPTDLSAAMSLRYDVTPDHGEDNGDKSEADTRAISYLKSDID
jgi:hypothetical protein